MECPNFAVCHKKKDPRLKVCSSCFWRFKNEILEFEEYECIACHEIRECVKFRKCVHFVCLTCFGRRIQCPCVLKDAGTSLTNG